MNKNKNFCHTHLHTDKGSLLDGLGKVSEYAEKAKEMGFRYLGISDHGSIDATIDFQNECLKRDIIPIIGSELYIVSSGDFKGKSAHVCVYVENEIGWKNLCEMLSIANLKHFYRKPRIDFDILYEKCDGLVITSACAGGFLKLDGGIDFFNKLHKKIGNNLYLEIMPHDLPIQHEMNEICLRLHKETGVKLITTTDAHYVNKEDKKIHDVLLAIQRKVTWNNPNRWAFDGDGYHLQSWDEILGNYAKIGKIDEKIVKKSLFNTNRIAEVCKDFRIQKREISLPDCNPFPYLDPKKALKKLYTQMAKDRLGMDLNNPEWIEYKDRAEMEYKVICDMGFEMYFLILEDFTTWCKKQGFTLGFARGSAAGSLLSNILGITEIDPIKHGLIFERFLNPSREGWPDIDLDIPDNKREVARQYLIDKYGEYNISGVSTFLYLKGKSVIRDVSRVFDVPLKEVDVFAKVLDDKGIGIVKRGVEETEEGKVFYKKYPEIVDIAIKLEGTVRGCSSHAAAVIVSSKNLMMSGQGNLKNSGPKGNKQTVINWDMNDAEYSGLIKIDLLGLSQLSIIDEALSLIKQTSGDELTIRDFLDFSDPKVYSQLSKGDTAGVFQMNTRTMTSYSTKLGIDSFDNIVAAIAAIRPGAMDAGFADEYLLRKNGKIWEPKHPIYEKITEETYGVFLYQEQVMRMFTDMAGLSFSIADNIRKIIGKKRDVREFDKYKDMFIDGCVNQKTMTRDEGLQFWSELEASANYSFNKSHSVGYGALSYTTAWLKYYYPAYFYSANLTCGSPDKKAQIVKEAFNYGLDIKLPKIGFSDASKWSVNDGLLIAPFSEIKGLGQIQAQEASQEKKQKFKRGSFYVTKDQAQNETKMRKLLTIIDAWDYNGKPSEHMQEYFEFPISNDLSVIAPTLLRMCKKHYTEDEIYKIYNGKKYPSKLKLIKSYKKSEEKDFECSGCSLQSRPYPTYLGDKTLMIIIEHPSYWDNERGKLLSCNTSNQLLMDLFEMDISYEDITVATGVKCYPGKGNKPIDEHKNKCWVYLEQDIQNAKPKVILSMGKACEFFDDCKISEKAGTFEWSEKYKCFIFYAWSFGYASISPENKEKYERSIRKFINTVKRVKDN